MEAIDLRHTGESVINEDSHKSSDFIDHDSGSIISEEVLNKFFAPVIHDELATLTGAFEIKKARILEVAEIIQQEKVTGVMHYFFEGNNRDGHGRSVGLRNANAVAGVFRTEGAIKELTAEYWQKALNATNLMELMPTARRQEWHRAMNAWREPDYKEGVIPENDMPEFTLDNLRASISNLMSMRPKFLAERVDGIFKALSPNHKTTRPEGFLKKMIIAHMFNDYGTPCYIKRDYVHDLRLVIAKFMGREEPTRNSTIALLELLKLQSGEWVECDGGSLRLKGYKVGTCHLEVHPEMAWRLNCILSFLYPTAIPESSKRPTKIRQGKGFSNRPLFERPISNEVLGILAGAETFSYLVKSQSFRREYDRIAIKNSLRIYSDYGNGTPLSSVSKHLKAEVSAVLSALGGVEKKHEHASYWQFDYYPNDIVKEVVVSGVIPDHRSYQYYPTPLSVAEHAVALAKVTDGESYLEPQAGQGGIADLLPKETTTCVEISPMHCQILREKGFTVAEHDFLTWEVTPSRLYDCVIMNPPFSEGRWQAHLQKGAKHVSNGGRLVAVLPTSARNKAAELLSGFEVQFDKQFDNAFDGTTISVVTMVAYKR